MPDAHSEELTGGVRNAQPKAPVKLLRGNVVTAGLDMHRVHATLFALGEQRVQRFSAQTMAPQIRTDIQIIYEGVAAAIFHAVAQSEHDISGRLWSP